MSRFNVGDIVGQLGSRYLYRVTASFEDFAAAAHLSEVSKKLPINSKKNFIRHITVDDFNYQWVKIKDIIKPKFKLDEKVFFYLDAPWSSKHDCVIDGTIAALVGELHNTYDLDSASYTYVIQCLDGSAHVIKESKVFKNVNTNGVWNSLIENTK
jgi:hypothetical protein